MNGIAANLLLHVTSSVRFEGTLNTDLNDITMNLVSWRRCVLLSSC
jgi:tubulin epsilon